MKSKYVKFEFFGLCGELGWFPGEDFVLFNFNICEICRDYPDKKILQIFLIHLKIIKLCFSIHWERS